jgi:hypothetical protein
MAAMATFTEPQLARPASHASRVSGRVWFVASLAGPASNRLQFREEE